MNTKKERKIYRICKCKKEFYASSTFFAHKRKCPTVPKEFKIKEENFLCKEGSCTFKCQFSDNFIKHLKELHGIEMEEYTLEFTSLSDFANWKETFQIDNNSRYVLKKLRKTATEKVKYFHCNRSRKPELKFASQQILKSPGTTIIGCNCPARIIARENLNTSKVTAYIRPHHYGHDGDVPYLPKSKFVKHQNELKLLKVPSSYTLNKIFSSYNTELEEYIYPETNDNNISPNLRIRNPISDADIVDMCVDELLEDNSILLYKRQSEKSFIIPNNICFVPKEDFVLGIMTKFQRDMLTEFGNEVVSLDVTRGTNLCDFKLISVLVIDDFDQCIPVAWLITNTESETVLKLFFCSIKHTLGDIMPKAIITNKAPQYFNSWRSVFGGCPVKLLNQRYVEKDWKKNLEKIWDENAISIVSETLSLLLEETNIDAFENLFRETCELLFKNENTKDFGKYIESEWVGIEEQWAKCFRVDAGINTDMISDSYHDTLKHAEQYLNVRDLVENCISVLLKFCKDLESRKFVKDENET